MALITESQRSELVALFIGMFDAAPGADYLNALVEQRQNGSSLLDIAKFLEARPEFSALYPPLLTANEYATLFTDRILGNEVAAAEREWVIDWIAGKLNAGVSPGTIILEATTALITSTNPLLADAKAAFLNQLEVAEYYSVTKQLSDDNIPDLQQVIANVTSSDATVAPAKAVIDNTQSGTEFVLTTGVDVFKGGASNDSFIATDLTYTGLDNLDGGAGIDALTINDVTGTVNLTSVTVTNIEKLFLNSALGLLGGKGDISKAASLTDATISLNAATVGQEVTASTTLASLTINNAAAKTLTVVGGAGELTIANGLEAVTVGGGAANKFTSATISGGTTVAVTDNSGAAAAVGSSLTSVAVSGNTGAATLTGKGITSVSVTNGVAASDVTIVNATAAHTQNLTLNNNVTGLLITDETATTVNVATTGKASAVAIAAAAATTLNASGSVALTLDTAGAVYTALETVNITSTGAVNADLTTAAALTAVVATGSTGANTVSIDATKATYAGGAGVDKVTVTKTATQAIDGGAGTNDVLVLNGVSADAQVGTKATGFEVLGLGAAANGAYDATGFAQLTQSGVAASVIYNNVSAAPTLTINATPGVGFNTTVNLKDVTGTSDSLAVKITGNTAIVANTITAAGVESVSINSDDSATTPTGIAHTVTLVATSAATVTVTGDAGLTLTNTNVDLTLVDASAVTKGAFSFTSAALTKAATINGGAGNDVINAALATKAVTVNSGAGNDTITTGAANDVINAGAGDDVINSGAGLDTVNVGEGNDTFILSANANGNIYTTLTGMGAGDKINFGAAADFIADQIVLAETAAFADYLQAAAAGTNGEEVTWFQLGGNTYVVLDTDISEVFVNGIDQVVKLTGLVDLSDATLAANVLTLA